MEHVDVKEAKKAMRRPKLGAIDVPFAMLVILIATIGLIMMFSASYASAYASNKSPTHFLFLQGRFMIIGIIVMFLISRVNYQILRGLAVPMMGVTVILLVLVEFIGTNVKGATRWLVIGGINVQPSEIAKFAVIVLFSALISTYKDKMKTFKYGILPFAVILAVVAGLVANEPHLSGAILILAVGAILLFLGGVHLGWFASGGVVVGVLLWIAFTVMPHARERIDVWQDPWKDPLDGGFQAIQSLYAIGSGGLFGLGLGKSRQKYLYLPEQHNDFVFSIVCEEVGMIGAIIVLFLFAVLIIRGYWIALHSRDRFGSLLVAGITTLLGFQTFFNVAVVTNLFPVTGISMPFFSYGGSSLLIQMAEMGVVLAISRQMSIAES